MLQSAIMANIFGKGSKIQNNIFTMNLDDELCLKQPGSESFNDECGISGDVLKDIDENGDDALLFPGSIIIKK